MDIMDIQAVESKLSDVTVTPIPRSQVQNFYNVQQMQREQREQQPQIQISAIHHNPSTSSSSSSSKQQQQRERDFHHHLQQAASSSNTTVSASAMAAALQYTQQLQAQLAMLQQQSNTTATAAATTSSNNNSHNNQPTNLSQTASQLKYPPLSGSPPVLITTQTSSNITTPMTSTANMSAPALSNGLTKYAQLLSIIEEMGRDIRPTYTGSRTSTERLKRGIVHARILVRECLLETERSARQ